MNTLSRRFVLLAWAGLALERPVWAQDGASFVLITPMEAQLAAAAEGKPPRLTRQVPPPRGPAPTIRVLTPSAPDTAVRAPLRIEAAFTPAPGTRIVPASFRVLYGLLKLDLTERLRPHATVSETGFVVERAGVPPGQHRLILQVADDQGHSTEQELLIRVAAAP